MAGRLFRNATYMTIAKVLGLGVFGAFGLILPRFLDVQHVGVFTVLGTLVFFGNAVSSLGLPAILVREVSQDHGRAPEAFVDGMAAMLTGAVLAAVCVFAWMLAVYGLDDPLRLLLAALACCIIALDAIGSAGDSLHRAFERMGTSAAADIAAAAVKVIGAVGALIVFSDSDSALVGIYVSFASGSALRAVWLYAASRRRFLPAALPRPAASRAWRLLSESIFVAVFRALRMLRARVDVLLLSILIPVVVGFGQKFVGDAACGIYGQAMRMVTLLSAFATGFAVSLFPRMASLLKDSDDFSEGREFFFRVLRFMTLWSAPLVVLGWVYAQQLAALFGEEYAHGIPELGLISTADVFRVLLIPFLFESLGGPVAMLVVTSRKMIRKLPWLGGGVAVVSIALNLVLIPRYGLKGAAIAALVAGLVEYVMKVYLTHKLLGEWRRGLPQGLPCVALAVAVGAMIWLTPLRDRPLLGAPAGLAVFSTLAWWFGLVDDAIKDLVRRLARRAVRRA